MVRHIVLDSWQRRGILLQHANQIRVYESTRVVLPRALYWSLGYYVQLRWCCKVSLDIAKSWKLIIMLFTLKVDNSASNFLPNT